MIHRPLSAILRPFTSYRRQRFGSPFEHDSGSTVAPEPSMSRIGGHGRRLKKLPLQLEQRAAADVDLVEKRDSFC